MSKAHEPDAVRRFHDHLDGCPRCMACPFDLCTVGALLLSVAGKAAAESLVSRTTHAKEVKNP